MPTTPNLQPPEGVARDFDPPNRAGRLRNNILPATRFGDSPDDAEQLMAEQRRRRSEHRAARDAFIPRSRITAQAADDSLLDLSSEDEVSYLANAAIAGRARQAPRIVDEDSDMESLSYYHEPPSSDAPEESDTAAGADTTMDGFPVHGEAEATATLGDITMESPPDYARMFDTTGLKEISNLASWTVSTCKPGSGVDALRSDDLDQFWQSDGPQPHHLNIHFSRMVNIVAIRMYLDFAQDESYTPTRLLLLAGTGYHDLIPFQTLAFEQPKGWIDVDLSGVGGGKNRDELRCFLLQVKVLENHQNGKDTHIRGLKIYARDDKASRDADDLGLKQPVEDDDHFDVDAIMAALLRNSAAKKADAAEKSGQMAPRDWFEEPELR